MVAGSTLLEQGLSLTKLNNFFEPLNRVRNANSGSFGSEWQSACSELGNDPEVPIRPHPTFEGERGSCSAILERSTSPPPLLWQDVRCPATDSLMLANILRCRFIANAQLVLASYEASTAAQSGGEALRVAKSWAQHDVSGSSSSSSKNKGPAAALAKAADKELKCLERPRGVLVKAIRINGHLATFMRAWAGLGGSEALPVVLGGELAAESPGRAVERRKEG